jgi:uncharacterized membrane protein YGL010W
MHTQGPPEATQRRVDALIAHYQQSHRHPVNERIHCIAVPLIMWSLVGLLWAVHPVLMGIFLLSSLLYYGRLSWRAAWVMSLWTSVVLLTLHWLAAQMALVCAAVFVLAWIAQFMGHVLEGRKPSFLEDLQYLWVGPLFVVTVLAQHFLHRFAPRFQWHW